jgi:endonuclease YncB( thermonuclease family)
MGVRRFSIIPIAGALLALVLVMLPQSHPPVSAAEPSGMRVAGQAEMRDGDTIRIGDWRIRLHGIDAPERDQICTRPDGAVWKCGRWAGGILAGLIARAEVSCVTVDRDRYGRLVARCAAAGTDLGAAMVAAGAALAYRRYSSDYVGAEQQARAAGLGIWSGAMATPEDHRRAKRIDASAQGGAAQNCPIKGNISANGRIFHRPGQADYDRVRIDISKGERWFCSAAEAQAAGWRPARR